MRYWIVYSLFILFILLNHTSSALSPDAFTRITSDGQLKIDYNNKVAKFHQNVEMKDAGGFLKCDFLTVYFDGAKGEQIEKMIARGNVKIKQNEHYAECGKADFLTTESKLVLTENPIIKKGANFYSSETIIIFTDTSRVIFEPSAKIVIKKDENEKKKETS